MADDLNLESWAQLLHLAQRNMLSLAYMLLTVIEDPEIVTDEFRDEALEMVIELEDGMARFEEFLV